MKTITLKNEFEVKSVLQSIASNVLQWKALDNAPEVSKEIIKDLIKLAVNIETQTNVKTYDQISIQSVFAMDLI